jgi:hypothetical protein
MSNPKKKKTDFTTIKLKDTTIPRLKALGTMGDSYDTVINRLLDEHDNNTLPS